LQILTESIDDFISLSLEETLSYAVSDRLYRNKDEQRLGEMAKRQFVRAIQTLDLSSLPSGFRQVLAIENLVRIADIHARIELPDLSDVPDAVMMNAAKETRWLIPGTQIEIVVVTEGRQHCTDNVEKLTAFDIVPHCLE